MVIDAALVVLGVGAALFACAAAMSLVRDLKAMPPGTLTPRDDRELLAIVFLLLFGAGVFGLAGTRLLSGEPDFLSGYAATLLGASSSIATLVAGGIVAVLLMKR